MTDYPQEEKSIFLQLFPELPKDKLELIPLPQKKGSNESKKWVYYFKELVYTTGKKPPSSSLSSTKADGLLRRRREHNGHSLHSTSINLLTQTEKRIKDFIKDHFEKTDISKKELVENLEHFKSDIEYREKILDKIFSNPFEFKKPIPPKYFFIALTLLKVKEHNLFFKKESHTLIKGFYTNERKFLEKHWNLDKEEFLKKYWNLLGEMEEIYYLSEVCYGRKHFYLEDNLRFNFSNNQGNLLEDGEKIFNLLLSESSQEEPKPSMKGSQEKSAPSTKDNERKTALSASNNNNTQSQPSNQAESEKIKDDENPSNQADAHNAKVLNKDELKKLEIREPEFTTNKGVRRYKTKPRISKTALHEAKYKCEYDSTHQTFTSGKKYPFTEAHHLIPMSKQENFESNIDLIANIVSLCPNCHRAVHLGNKEEKEKRLEVLYEIKKEALKEANLCHSFQELLTYYKTNKNPRASRSTT